jgi:hypothetical protein
VNNEWVRFTVRLDYAARKWDLYASRAMSGGAAVRVGRALDFVTGSTNMKVREFRVSTDGTENAYLDNLSITDASVSGIPFHLLGTQIMLY